MKHPPSPRPTDAELDILAVLWDQGPSTVREVHERLHRPRGAGYTTTLKLMQIMAGKELVERDESQRAHVYRPALSKSRTAGKMTGELLDRLFGGSAERLMMHLLGSRKVSRKEIARIRKMLDEVEDRTDTARETTDEHE